MYSFIMADILGRCLDVPKPTLRIGYNAYRINENDQLDVLRQVNGTNYFCSPQNVTKGQQLRSETSNHHHH